MRSYNNFIFKDYLFDNRTKTLRLYYSFDGLIEFNESYKFDFEYVDYDEAVLDRAIQALFYMAGVSYYKAYKSDQIVIEKGEMDVKSAEFFAKTYQKGLGEFFYVNKLDPNQKIEFPVNCEYLSEINNNPGKGLLVGIGGGKDSLVSVEFLRDSTEDVTTWSVGHRNILEPLVKEIGLPHLWIERTWDRTLLEHNLKGALNGHVPISAIYACVGTVAAILSGKYAVVVSNERSANEPDLKYRGVEINHQYSKSVEFERDFQEYLRSALNSNAEYFSFLRPLSEVFIAEIFSKIALDKYKAVFSSCNRAFTHESQGIYWCGQCPKCAFTFLALTPFVNRQELETIWDKNLLLHPSLRRTYDQLLGIAGDKPLDCVGEIKESRAAMRLAQRVYPELYKYKFSIPKSYNYRSIDEHVMPESIFKLLESKINKTIYSKHEK